MKTAEAAVAGRPSPSIWGDCPIAEMLLNSAKGLYIFEDFHSGIVADATLVLGQRHGLVGYVDSDQAADVALQSDEKGVIKLDQDGTDDDVTVVTTGDNVTGLVKVTSGDQKKMWFEARVKLSTITDGDLAAFIGLTEEGQAADGKPLGAAGAIGDIDHIGFSVKEDDGDALELAYTKAGQADATPVALATLVADTYVRLGLKFEPLDNKVHVYVDGVEIKDAAISAAATNFPSGEKLAVTFAIASGANGADGDGMYVDWFCVAQEY